MSNRKKRKSHAGMSPMGKRLHRGTMTPHAQRCMQLMGCNLDKAVGLLTGEQKPGDQDDQNS